LKKKCRSKVYAGLLINSLENLSSTLKKIFFLLLEQIPATGHQVSSQVGLVEGGRLYLNINSFIIDYINDAKLAYIRTLRRSQDCRNRFQVKGASLI
jgi:hypothetical protein